MPLCGIYKIINKITKEFYIGSSVNIKARFSSHMNRDARKCNGKDIFHTAVNKYKKENFELIILEICDRKNLIKREQFYYDTLKPQYNEVRPSECNFKNPYVREKSKLAQQTKEYKEKIKKIHESKEYREKCKQIHTKGLRKMKKIVGINVETKEKIQFDSLKDGERYINETSSFKGKNKVSKIKSVCDGERPSAYGYKWIYREV